MKIVKPKKESVIVLDGELFQLDAEDKTVNVGTLLFDGRHEEFMIVEDQNDADDYVYVAPEAYIIFKKVDAEDVLS